MITKFEKYKWYDKSFEGKDGVHTYVKLKNGEIWILWSEDHENETMTIYPKFIENFDPETDHWRLKTVNHDEVLKTDTNLACL